MGRWVVVLLLLCPLAAAADAAEGVTDRQVQDAIDRMKSWLYSQQDPRTGAWVSGLDFPGPDDQAHGETAIVTLALLSSGESPQAPRLAQALRYLRDAEMNGTYAVSLRAHVWAALPETYLPQLRADARWLLDAHQDSLWDYGPRRRTRVDHSTTQYGILGLWEFSKRGGTVPDRLWEDAVRHFMESQHPSGGWTYSRGPTQPVTGSMTTAGLTVLHIAAQELYRDRDELPAPLTAAIDRGLAWLDAHFEPDINPGRGERDLPYYLYGIERVALASGLMAVGGRDWFEAGAAALLAMEAGRGQVSDRGGSLANTAFALMFLSRGRVPVWITKLHVPGIATNRRPNDLYFLTRYLSDLRERELNWQAVNLELDVARWRRTPAAFLSSDEPVALTPGQLENLRAYLDGGGLLIANAEDHARRFTASIRHLVARLYPEAEAADLRPLPADHPLFTMLHPVSPAGRRQVRGYGNGARDLVLLLPRDVSEALQAGRPDAPRPTEADAWRLMTNLYLMVTERDRLPNRLESPLPPRTSRPKAGTIRVTQALPRRRLGVEPGAWQPIETVLFNRTGLELERVAMPLESVAAGDAALVHLAGVEPIKLTEAEQQALRAFVQAGGTVLVENLGGKGDFSISLTQQLQSLFGQPALPVPPYDPLLTGEGLGEGAHAIERVVYRPFSVAHKGAGDTARLAALRIDDRPAILVSHEDLSLGALGVTQWGIHGYHPASARALLVNILLASHRSE